MVLCAVGILAASCGDSDGVSERSVGTAAPATSEAEAQSNNVGSAATSVPTEPTETTAATTTTAAPEVSLVVGESGFVLYEALEETWANGGAEVTNGGDDLSFVEVTFNFLGADNIPVATESEFIEFFPSGATIPVAVTATEDMTGREPVAVEIFAFGETDSFFEAEGQELPIENVEVADGSFGRLDVRGTATNTTGQVIDFTRVSCVILRDDGAIIGGAFTFLDRVAPDQTVAWEAGLGSEGDALVAAGASSARCAAVATLD